MKKLLLVLAIIVCMLAGSCALAEPVVFQDEASLTGYSVTFTFDDPDAALVQLYGEWAWIDAEDASIKYTDAEWNPTVRNFGGTTYDMVKGEDGLWTVTVPLPNGLFGYRFLVSDGTSEKPANSWDPTNLPINVQTLNGEEMLAGEGNDYYLSTIYVPFDAEKQTTDLTIQAPRTDEYKGTLEFIKLEESLYPFTVYLPYNFDVNREEPYKLYILYHGGGGFYANWVNNGGCQNIVDNLIAEGRFGTDTVILMPQLSFSVEGSKYNYFENGWSQEAQWKANMHDTACIREAVLPYMYEHYNVSEAAEDHAIGGLSGGAVFTSAAAVELDDLFGYYHWMSGCVFSNNVTLNQVVRMEKEGKKFYFSCNPIDMCYGEIETNVNDLTAMGYDHMGYTDLGTGHCWHSWRLHLANYLENILWK